MLEARSRTKELAEDGRRSLTKCTAKAKDAVTVNSYQQVNDTTHAIDRGQKFLDSLGLCSRKSGLLVISCYRNVILNDVVPVKNMLLGAIKGHREGHFEAVRIREEAHACVDGIVKKYKSLLEQTFTDALTC